MSSIFTKIINGEIPCYKVAEDTNFFAFLDINPNAIGHTLVVPKKETDKIFDLSKDEYLDLMNFAYRVAKAQEKVIECNRIGMSVVGLEVPHTHVHLIPIKDTSDMQFTNKVECNDQEFKNIALKIAKEFT